MPFVPAHIVECGVVRVVIVSKGVDMTVFSSSLSNSIAEQLIFRITYDSRPTY